MSDSRNTARIDYESLVTHIFEDAPFMRDLGVTLGAVAPGRVESRLPVLPRHCQQNGFLHAGVAAAIADHSAGAAAATLMPVGRSVLTVEFKVNLLRPGLGAQLRCVATVLKPGNRLSVAESDVFMGDNNREKLIAKATVTLAFVESS